MLKINLSDQDGVQDPDLDEDVAFPDVDDDTTVIEMPDAPEVSETPEMPPPEQKGEKTPARHTVSPALMIVLLVTLIAVAAYLNRGFIMSLLPEKTEPVVVVEAPPVEPEPVVEAVGSEPDPTFVLLNTISDVVPPRVWLTEVVLRYDGTYDIKGMSFTHEAMSVLNGGLAAIGTVTDSYFPRKTDSAETIYRFSVSGKVADFVAPDILDIIPGNILAPFSAPVIEKSGGMGITFTGAPESGKTYGEADMPFALQGSFAGLKQVIGAFCDSDPDVRVYQLVIVPDGVGLPFDKVDATFSLRIRSSI